MSTKDLVCWTAMITAYEQAEKPVEALILFKKMQQEEGLLADSIAVVSVASAVGQLGDVRNAQTVHGYAFRKSLIEELCVASNKWKEVGKLRQDMKNKGLKKPAAFSMIEYGKNILGFHTADQENPYRHEVYKKMESLAIEMKMAGYVPDLSCALHDVEEEDKEHMLNYHSEKLALAFGILKIDHGMVIRVTKNLRVCNDCHSAFKIISNIYQRKIIVRDANRFHHFQGGTCSCKDYW
ncbi:hypothetical protein OIU78_016620 [Salix suchowensis]|nr:hypothetical protein OIU78_016620 [Salix suchowensis]